MPIAKARFVYDLGGTPITYTDLYDKPGVDTCLVKLGSTRTPSTFEVALENLDGSKNSAIVVEKEAKVEIDPGTGVWQNMIRGYVTDVGLKMVGKEQELVLVVKGLDYGSFLLPGRSFSKDYWFTDPKIRDAVVNDIIAGQGITGTNVQAGTIITENTKRPFEFASRWDILIDFALEAACDIYVDETLDLHFFKAYPNANTPSTGKTFTDADFKFLDFWKSARDKFARVYALGIFQREPKDPNHFQGEGQSFWSAGTFGYKKPVSGSSGPDGPRAIEFGQPANPSACSLGRWGDGGNLGIDEDDWHNFTFTIYHNIGSGVTAKLFLEQSGTDYWWRTITSDLVLGGWKTIDYKLPTEDPTSWTKVGNPTLIHKVKWQFDNPVSGGTVKFQWIFFYRRIRGKSEVSPLPSVVREKVVIDPKIEDAQDLNNLAASELVRVKDTFIYGTLRIDGDLSLRRPGHTCVINSTKFGTGAQTVRIDEIIHRLQGKYHETVVSFSNSVARKVLPYLREQVGRIAIGDRDAGWEHI